MLLIPAPSDVPPPLIFGLPPAALLIASPPGAAFIPAAPPVALLIPVPGVPFADALPLAFLGMSFPLTRGHVKQAGLRRTVE
ncbi:hypothetical protein ACFTSF_27165 [Kribbella sp. NPDC056951]|uniref:hypothetical protein n=1 Tax=Kribbella sp. NPDC056951 TaxID=3345978 RepID=UPI00362864F3